MDKETIATYQKIAADYSRNHFENEFWASEFNTFKKSISGNRVIELGCGAGRDATLFSKDHFNYIGIDASSEMITQARARVPRGTFVVMDFQNLAFRDETFDGFWASASLLHNNKETLLATLQGIHHILRPNGIGFISLKEKTSIDEGYIPEDKYGGKKRFFAFWENAEIIKLLQAGNFDLLENHPKTEDDGTKWLCYLIIKR